MDAVEEIKQRLSIEEVISEYVQLKRSGRNFKGLSPFTSEKTPSFMVSPEKQIWHDFSSGKGGNMFSFVMEMEGLDFKGALELLARKAGVDLEQYRQPNRRGPDKERLYEALELAARFYQVQFTKNPVALEYVFKKRRFTKETALEWRLGYAPNTTGTALVTFLKSKGFTDGEARRAGLSAQRYRGAGDMFRGRLMIPLQDPQGRVIGFTARLLIDDANAPKYINTPQTVLYDKSRHVFGLHLAKEAIRKNGFAVVVEGNLDVIASHQAGVKHVVATAGTALTEHHLKALSRFTDDIRLCFDADRAGVAATERAIPIASRAKVSLGIIDIPSGKDPDELVKQDPELWRQAVQKRQYALDWLMDRYKTVLDITSAEGKRRFSDVLLPVVRALSDAVEQDHYLSVIAETIGVSKEALNDKLNRTEADMPKPLKRSRAVPAELDRQAVERTKTQEHFLALMLFQPPLRSRLDHMTVDMFSSQSAGQLLTILKEHPDVITSPAELDRLTAFAKGKTERKAGDTSSMVVQSVADYGKILWLEYEELYQGLEFTELQYEAARLQARLIEQFVKLRKQEVSAQFDNADETQTQALLIEVKHLDDLLRHAKGGV